MEYSNHLKFVPFASAINSSFWDSFSKLKLNEIKLSTDPVDINGIYNRKVKQGIPPLLHVQYDFMQPGQLQPGEINAHGTLISVNTIEEFKQRDKKLLLESIASKTWDAIVSGEAEKCPFVLSTFFIFIYADLKKYHYYYWCAFPAFLHPSTIELVSPIQNLKNRLTEHSSLIEEIRKSIKESDFDVSFFTLLVNEKSSVKILPLDSYYQQLKLKTKEKYREVWLGFSDPSSSLDHPGWGLRNLLTLAAVRWKDEPIYTILALRETASTGLPSIEYSLVLEVRIKEEETPSEMPSIVGWEKNERGKMGPRFCNMTNMMDQSRVAESTVDLNLKLMKWRLDPALDLELIKNCRCLLIGAGTLGCNVARVLMGWGVNKITFVDSGRVSYSNPVRQSLYVFEDCLQNGKMKAEAAAQSLKRIFPRVNAEGVVLSVPMPGHPVDAGQLIEMSKAVSTLEGLIESHDVIFLLTDSRESRWLPSLIGAAKNKIIMTAALGFDSYLVMRHGVRSSEGGESSEESFGCYFCNDVVAPGDSTTERTLDQQCTVTRPGVSFIAAGHIVELLIDLLQQPIRIKNGDRNSEVYHSIRYYLGRMDQLLTSSPTFKNCSACSPTVISMYEKMGFDFLVKVFNSPKYLEEVSGLAKLHQESQNIELYALSDSEDSE